MRGVPFGASIKIIIIHGDAGARGFVSWGAEGVVVILAPQG